MKVTKVDAKRAALPLCLSLMLLLTVAFAASCGGSGTSKSNSTTKLPPGVDNSQTTKSSTPASTATSSQEQAQSGGESTTSTETQTEAATTPDRAVDLVGGRFTVASASRPDTNKSVLASGGREVSGDYLEIEFTIQNVGTDLIDLSDYSFRLTSPGIAAGTYADYYGETGTYGKYVDENEISASLLGYSDLSTVTCVMKIGESVNKVFVFFDLNPENVAKNAAVTKDNTTLIIRKVSGTDYGEEVTVPLAGYSDQ